MRTLLFFLLPLALALPLRAQDATFFELRRQIESAPETVESEAMTVAQTKHYLRDIPQMGDPTILVTGDVHLRIDETPFTLYLQSTNHHTDARLESQALDVPERVRQKAKAFLRDVIDRVTSKRG